MEELNNTQQKPKILLIDGWNVYIAMNATTYIEDHNTQPAGAYIGTLNQIRTFVEIFKPTKVLFVLDGPEAGERRRKLYPDYKGGRRIKERESKVQIMDGEDNIVYGVEGAFQNQFIKLYEFLNLLPVTVCLIPYAEADDVITSLALKNKDDYDCVIISNDRDYLQLIQPGIMVYRWKTKRLYDEKVFQNEFNIKVENYIFRKVLLGDTSDKVEGIKGIGEKTFKKIEKSLSESVYKNIDEFSSLLESIDEKEFSTREFNSFKKAVSERDKMELCYKIMKLDKECLSPEQEEVLGVQIEEQENKLLSRLTLKIKIKKNPFNKLYNGFNEDRWLQPFLFLKPGIKINC